MKVMLEDVIGTAKIVMCTISQNIQQYCIQQPRDSQTGFVASDVGFIL
jgi:hypothetical protein